MENKEKIKGALCAPLCFTNELFLALGAGNGDLTLALGNTDLLAALRAIVIAMLLILKPLQQHKILAVLLVTLVGISGKHPEESPNYHTIIKQGQKQVQPGDIDKDREHRSNKACRKDHRIQLIRTIAALHETPQACCDICTQTAEPATDTVHNDHLIV